MIPNNGFIEVEILEQGKDEFGFPTGNENQAWGKKIPCHINKNTENKRGSYNDGKFTNYAFTVWFDMREFKADKVRLTDNRGQIKGVFEVQNIEFHDLTQRVSIDL